MDAAEKFAVGLGGGEKDDKCSSCVRWVEMSSLRSLHGGMWVWKPVGPIGLLFSP